MKLNRDARETKKNVKKNTPHTTAYTRCLIKTNAHTHVGFPYINMGPKKELHARLTGHKILVGFCTQISLRVLRAVI